jgi:Pyridoxamine 5'-phosphate oxidase
MTDFSDEVVEFLSAGTRTAMLGYLAADGRPLVAPAWFIVDNGELVFNTGRESAKGRALARDSRVVICVDDPHPPHSFVAGCRAAKKKLPRTTAQRTYSTSRLGLADGTLAHIAPRSSASAMPSPASWGAGPADQGQLGLQYRRLTRPGSTRLWRCTGFRFVRR